MLIPYNEVQMKLFRIIALIFVGVTFAAGISFADSYDRLASELSQSAQLLKNPKVAIIPFSYVDKRKSDGGAIVVERLTTRIVKLKKFQVIERQLLENVLQELHLETTGVVDAETTRQLGKVLGVDAIVAGTLLDVENGMVELNARVIKTETAEVIGTASVEIEKIWQDISTAQAQQPAAPQQQQQQPSAQQVYYAPPPKAAPKVKQDVFFDLFFAGGSGKATITFNNYSFPVRETDLNIDFDGDGTLENAVSYTKIIINDAATDNSSTLFGGRMVAFSRNFGFSFEMSNFAQVTTRQKTTISLGSSSKALSINSDDYIKVNSFALLSGDLLLRFAKKKFQPYVGIGLGLAINNISSPYIYAYSGSVYTKPMNETVAGFLFRVPMGARIVLGDDASAFIEYRPVVNSFNFTRGIKNETDSVALTAGFLLLGAGFKF